MNAPRILDRVVRPAPLGLRFRDVATGLPVRDDLKVTVVSVRNPLRKAELAVNGHGVWYAHRFPGFGDLALAATTDWTPLRQPCRITVEDHAGRFLPLAVDLDLPVRGLADWPGWSALPQAPLAPLIDDPATGVVCPQQIPLFSSTARTAPGPLAEVRAQLVRADDGGPAAWAIVTATYAGHVHGIGQADGEGRVVLFFSYPDRPRAALATSPPAITDFRWPLEITAYWNGLAAGAPPSLAEAMGQLSHPRDLFRSTASPAELLPAQLLSLGRPLTLQTADTPLGPSSFLIMAAA
jgi:hypothetical protein